tara:strand:- start:39242 stop:40672 length:1431 start_codon:yes stop_codon:yes gene_type:complete
VNRVIVPTWKDLISGKKLYQYRKSSFDAESYIDQGIYIPRSLLFRSYINPFNIYLFIVASSFLLGFFAPVLFSVSIGLAVYLMLVFYNLETTAKSMVLERTLDRSMFTEGDELTMKITVANKSKRTVSQLLLRDYFGGTSQPTFCYLMTESVPAGKRQKVSYKKSLDVGMGEYRFENLQVTIVDPMGIFYLEVVEDEPVDIYVGPRVQPLRNMIFYPSQSSRGFGQHEVKSRGENVNFEGIRDYAKGDPVRHIAWKLSAKRAELFVKTFENQVNIDVTFFMELHPKLQLGYQGFSTWEYMRDIAISMMTQLVSSGEKFQMITNNMYIPFGTGKQHMYFIGRHLATNLTEETILQEDTENLLMLPQYRHYLPNDSVLYYLVPYVPHIEPELVNALAFLKHRGGSSVVVLIDALTIVEKMPFDSRRVMNMYNYYGNYKKEIYEFSLKLKEMGVDVYLGQYNRFYWDSVQKVRRGMLGV